MKTFSILFFIFINASANTYVKQSREYASEGMYFLALDILAKQYKQRTPDNNVESYLEYLVSKTGTHYFNTFKDIELRKMNIPTTDLIMAQRNLFLGKYKYVFKRAKRIPKGHRLFPEAQLIMGNAYFGKNDRKNALKKWQRCSESALKRSHKTKAIDRYFNTIAEQCITNEARMYYKSKNYKKAIKAYESVPKKSFIWPYTLLEKAWAYHKVGNYNKALGILMTYNSPLLSSYFNPEVEYLKALSLYKLCLFDETIQTVDNFYKQYKPISDELNKLIRSKKSFLDFVESPIKTQAKKNKFLRNVITQLKSSVKFNLDRNTLVGLNGELKKAIKRREERRLNQIKKDLQQQMNHLIKVSSYRLVNNINRSSKNLYQLKLEALSRKRTAIYSSRQKILTKEEVINQFDSDYEYWDFTSEFWADELGEYSFKKGSLCEREEA